MHAPKDSNPDRRIWNPSCYQLHQRRVLCTPTEIQTPIFPLEGGCSIQLNYKGICTLKEIRTPISRFVAECSIQLNYVGSCTSSRSRTGTPIRAQDFKSGVTTNSTTEAYLGVWWELNPRPLESQSSTLTD